MDMMLSMVQVTPLKLAIVSSGRTMRDVAACVGIDETVMSRYAGGHRQPKIRLAQAIARELGVSVEALWPEHDGEKVA